ncbi:MAG: 2-phospho-L-lactate guanylyltransferase [Promethearchaeota archaeon]
MDTYALIPMKKLGNSKTRISNISPEARKSLTKAMLTDTIQSALEAKSISETFVMSPDHDIIKLAEKLGAKTILEKDERGLNVAVSEGTDELEKHGAEGVMVILGDLPLLTSRLLDLLIKKAISQPWVVIAPSKDNGTNILLRTPPKVIPHVYYGQNSSIIHIRIAQYYHISYTVFRSPRLMIDIDTLQDFALIRKYESGKETHTFQVLQELKFF